MSDILLYAQMNYISLGPDHTCPTKHLIHIFIIHLKLSKKFYIFLVPVQLIKLIQVHQFKKMCLCLKESFEKNASFYNYHQTTVVCNYEKQKI